LINPEQIKEKALSGFFWSMTENGGSYFLHFLIGLVLVRLIEPVDYGIFGMLTFFITLSTILTEFGLSTALVQKKSPTDEDFSTVFWTNIFIAIICYLIILLISNQIAIFYSEPVITLVIKVYALNFVISAFGVVHTTKINRTMNYKLWTRINLISLLLSGIIAIIFAYNKMGLWALIYIQIAQNLFNTIQLWVFCEWKHGFKFSIKSLKELVKFSKPLTFINVLNVFYVEMYNLLIGRFFRAEKLAFYLRAKQTSEIFATQFNATLTKVMFPVLSNFQDDDVNLRATFHKIIIMTGFINFCVLAFLASNGENLFVLLYTDKWISSVPLFQFLCIEVMFLPLHSMAGNLLIARSKTKNYMYIELSKRVLQAIIISLSLKSLETIVYGQIIIAFCFTIIAFVIVEKEINIKIWKQIKELLPYTFLAGLIYFVNYININYVFDTSRIVVLLLNLIISLFLYIFVSYLLKLEAYIYTSAVLIDKYYNFRARNK
jgi:O-antigen/teichoic acid export membrane protein